VISSASNSQQQTKKNKNKVQVLTWKGMNDDSTTEANKNHKVQQKYGCVFVRWSQAHQRGFQASRRRRVVGASGFGAIMVLVDLGWSNHQP
jgi:hypothetical protein